MNDEAVMALAGVTFFAAMVATVSGLVIHVRNQVMRWRLAKGQCLLCGYDLRGSPSNRCPECGFPRA